jgi:hypothetical protein
MTWATLPPGLSPLFSLFNPELLIRERIHGPMSLVAISLAILQIAHSGNASFLM